VIVTCESCETQFQLDDTKVPETGIRVRCSRCKHAFFVESPRARDQDRADSLAREALTRGALGPGPDSEAEDGESDWEFNEEVSGDPPGGDERFSVREAVDDLLGGSAPSEPEPPAEPPAEPDLRSQLARGLGAAEGFDLGGSDLDVPDLSSEPDLAPEDEPFGGDLDRSNQLPQELDGGAVEAPAAEPSPAAAGDAAPEGLSGLDAFLPEEEFFGDLDGPELDTPGEPEPLAERGQTIGRIAPVGLTEASPGVERSFGGRSIADESAFDLDADAGATEVWLGRARAAIGWVSVCLLCAWAVLAGLGPPGSERPETVSPPPVGGFAPTAIRGYWIENAAVGPIYVISGQLGTGPTGADVRGKQLRVRLLDAAGNVLAVQSAVVGPPIAERLLREWELSDLRALQEERALRMAWQPVGSGGSRPFQAILGDLPSTAVAFKFQVVDAAPPVTREPEPAPGIAVPAADAGEGFTG